MGREGLTATPSHGFIWEQDSTKVGKASPPDLSHSDLPQAGSVVPSSQEEEGRGTCEQAGWSLIVGVVVRISALSHRTE